MVSLNIKMKLNKKLNSFNLQEVFTLLKRLLIVILLYSASRVLFYFYNITHFPGITFSRLLRIMQGGIRFDIAALFYVNSLYILLYLLPFNFRYKKKYKNILKYIFFITNGIALAINTMDFFYFDFILKRSTADVFMFAKEGNILHLFLLFFTDYWIGIIIWISLMFILIFLYRKTDINKNENINKFAYYISGLFWLIFVLYFSVIGIRGGFTRTTRPINLNNAGKYTEKPIETAIVLNTPFSIIRTINKRPLELKNYFTESELKSIYSPIHQADTTNNFNNKNVVIFIIESMGKEYIGSLNKNIDNGNYEGFMPFIDSLIKQSKTFTRAFANGRKSIDALPSVVASIPSMVNPYVSSKYSTNNINSIASLLKKKGYETAFFHGAPNGSMGFESFMKIAGYNKYFGMTEYNNDDDFDGSWAIWDEEFFQFYANEINKMKQPFHTSLFSASSHHPFKVPEKYNGKFKKGILPIHIPIQYTDMALKKFFKTASKMDWYKNTIFVITADHCSQSAIDKYKTEIGSFSIPIIIFEPSNPNFKGIDSTIVQQMDIMPTVLNMLNYDKNYISFGNNMLDTTINHFAINYINNTYQITKGDFVLQYRNDKVTAIYNYEKDSLLKHNLLGQQLDNMKDMKGVLQAFIQEYNYRMINNELTIK